MNKRGKSCTIKSVSEFFHVADWAKSIENPKSRGKSPSGRMFRWPCKDCLTGTCNNSSRKRWHLPECLFYKDGIFQNVCSARPRAVVCLGNSVRMSTSSGWRTADEKVQIEQWQKCRATWWEPWSRVETRTYWTSIISCTAIGLCISRHDAAEERETFHDRTRQPVVRGQSSSSSAPSVIKTEVLLDCDWRMMTQHIKIFCQRCEERIERLSQQDKVSKFCMDAAFPSIVEIGQYFMTKDNHNGEQFYAMAGRKDTLPLNDGSSGSRGWIQGNTKIETILTPGSEFPWLRHVGHEFEQQWAGNFRSTVRRISVEI